MALGTSGSFLARLASISSLAARIARKRSGVSGWSVLLTVVQLWPSLELTQLSVRADLTYEDAVAFSLLPQKLVLFLIPHYYGRTPDSYWGPPSLTENYLYVGILPLLLAIARTGGEAGFWERVIARREQTDADFRRARELVLSTGALQATLDLAQDYADRAKRTLRGFPAGEWRSALEGLADFAVTRAA